MSVPHHCIPRVINAGETVSFTVSDSSHPASAWTMVFVLNNGLCAPTSTAATTNTDGKSFDVTLSAAVSAGLAQGVSTAMALFTRISDSVKEAGRAHQVNVVPSITAIPKPTDNEIALAACIATIAKISAQRFSSTSFNGQSSTTAQLDALQKQKVTLQAAVIAERKALLAARGGHVDNGRIQTEFVGSCDGPPYALGFPFYP